VKLKLEVIVVYLLHMLNVQHCFVNNITIYDTHEHQNTQIWYAHESHENYLHKASFVTVFKQYGTYRPLYDSKRKKKLRRIL